MTSPTLNVLVASFTLLASQAFGAEDLEAKVADLWLGTDAHRIEFVTWVNSSQSLRGLTAPEVRDLLGDPDSEHPNSQYPYNGLSGPKALSSNSAQPVIWLFKTIRLGTKESEEWGGEGSGYLMDLEVHFGADGVAYGCGSTQYVTGGDYYEMLDERRSTQ